jgi:hypothetical protein
MSEKNPVNQSEYVGRQEKQTDEANLDAPSHGSISHLAQALWQALW